MAAPVVAISEPIFPLAAVDVSIVAAQKLIFSPKANTAAMFSSLKNTPSGRVGTKEEPPTHKAQSSAQIIAHSLPNSLTDLQARQIKQQNAKQEAQLAGKRECKEANDSACKVVAIKQCKDAEKHRQHEAKLGHQGGSDVPGLKTNKVPTVSSPMPTHKAILTKALEPKRLTPGPNGHKQAMQPKPTPRPLSPIDTYEISDREESTDDDEDSEERQRKHMPTWASGINLREALRAQANSDPSIVFTIGASSCDLKNIFKTDRVFKKRTSSQNWGLDLSTQMERQKYCTEMGFTPPK